MHAGVAPRIHAALTVLASFRARAAQGVGQLQSQGVGVGLWMSSALVVLGLPASKLWQAQGLLAGAHRTWLAQARQGCPSPSARVAAPTPARNGAARIHG